MSSIMIKLFSPSLARRSHERHVTPLPSSICKPFKSQCVPNSPCEANKSSSDFCGLFACGNTLAGVVLAASNAHNVPKHEAQKHADVNCLSQENFQQNSPAWGLFCSVVHDVGNPDEATQPCFWICILTAHVPVKVAFDLLPSLFCRVPTLVIAPSN